MNKVFLRDVEVSLGFPHGTRKATFLESSHLLKDASKEVYCIINEYNHVLIENTLYVGAKPTVVIRELKFIKEQERLNHFNIVREDPDWDFIRSLAKWRNPDWVPAIR